jgi:hypothetical protein
MQPEIASMNEAKQDKVEVQGLHSNGLIVTCEENKYRGPGSL